MAYEKIAADLVAVYYAANLTPDPTLNTGTDPDPDAMAAYLAKGRELHSALLTPTRRASIRCTCGTRAAHPDQPARALAYVHDRNLLVVRQSRGPVSQGLRLVGHLLVDLPLARGQGFRSAGVYCYGCGAFHELGFGWLHDARTNEVSTPSEQFILAPWGAPVTPQGYTPRHPNDAGYIAFAETTGPLEVDSEILITLAFSCAITYRNHFGFKPPHEAHLLRLVGDGDPRIELPPQLREILIPQWRRLQLDPEKRSEEQFEEPLSPDGIAAIAGYITGIGDAIEREEALLTFEQLLQDNDFPALLRALTEETP